jgi:hypothetical protein
VAATKAAAGACGRACWAKVTPSTEKATSAAAKSAQRAGIICRARRNVAGTISRESSAPRVEVVLRGVGAVLVLRRLRDLLRMRRCREQRRGRAGDEQRVGSEVRAHPAAPALAAQVLHLGAGLRVGLDAVRETVVEPDEAHRERRGDEQRQGRDRPSDDDPSGRDAEDRRSGRVEHVQHAAGCLRQ